MSFLAPFFLLGALAVALPVVFHLIRRSVKDRTMFSSLMFLLPSPPRLTRRSRLEHLLLLALRCAALCLLALGFARPFLKHAFPPDQSGGPAKRVLVLLDTSASMQRQDLWNRALTKAGEIARQAGPGDSVALFTFDRQLRPLVSFDQWNAAALGDRLPLVRSRLAQLKPGWSATVLDRALIEAAELFENRSNGDFSGVRQVVVISDFQEGSHLTALQGHQWPKDVEILAEPIVPRRANNAGLQLATDRGVAAGAVESALRVRISNAPDSRQEQFQVGWAASAGGYVGKPVDVYVPPGQSRVISISNPGTNAPSADRVVLRGDDESFDNTVYVLPPVKKQVEVLYLGDDQDGDSRQPLFFLRRALQDTPQWVLHLVNRPLSVPLSQAELDAAALLVVTGTFGDGQAAVIRDALLRGRSLLFAPTTAAAATNLATILGVELPVATEKKLENYAMLAEIDFTHPMFEPFADSRYSDFTKIHFWKYRNMDLSSVAGVRAVARFDTGDPAIVEVPVGKGRVFVFASGWHPADSQLALSTKFVPMLYSILELSGAVSPAPRQYFVGASVPVMPDTAIQLPGGNAAALQAGETNFTVLEPGVYSLGSASSVKRFAVNLEPAESRTAPMPVDELERFGVPGQRSTLPASAAAEKRVRLQNAELEGRQKLWRWLIISTLAVLALETWLGGWTWHRSALREKTS